MTAHTKTHVVASGVPTILRATSSSHRAAAKRSKESLFQRWARVADERRALATADDALLKDLGVTRADAQAEASRFFWDLPRGR